MDSKVKSLKKICIYILGLYILGAGLFLILAQEQIKYTSDNEIYVQEKVDRNVDEVLDGDVFLQECIIDGEYISGLKIYFQTYGRKDLKGEFLIEVYDGKGENLLIAKKLPVEEVDDASWNKVDFKQKVSMENVENNTILVKLTNTGGEKGSTVSLCFSETDDEGAFYVRGEKVDGSALSIATIQNSKSKYAVYYVPVLLIGFGLIMAYCVLMVRAEKRGKENIGLHFIHVFTKYGFLIEQLVSRDFKTKYKRSVLGVFWSFLNPLLTMSVQYVVFSNLFRFQIPNYAVYLLTGIILYSSFSDTTTQAMNSITGNVSLITKVYVPKYIYPVSKVLSTSINLLLSLIPLVLVALFTGIHLKPSILLLPFLIICFIGFMIGISFVLSSAMVFFRDMQFLWGVFTMMWMYATPIMYPIEQLPIWMQKLENLNPLYHYISFFRVILINGISPEPSLYIYCIIFALVFILLGGYIFKKTQDKFVLHI